MPPSPVPDDEAVVFALAAELDVARVHALAGLHREAMRDRVRALHAVPGRLEHVRGSV
jgi:hypothetical protein